MDTSANSEVVETTSENIDQANSEPTIFVKRSQFVDDMAMIEIIFE